MDKEVYKVVKMRRFEDYKSSSALGNFSLTYKLNVSVIALSGTYGIFCFETYDDAILYINKYFDYIDNDIRKVLVVKPFGSPFYPKYISKDGYCKAYYLSDGKLFYCKSPKGTVCFDKIVPIRLI
jgi:hypothetical protein